MSRRFLFRQFNVAAAALLALAVPSTVGADNCFMCRKPVVDMQISLAVGTIRSPEFKVKDENYLIMVRTERRLPLSQQKCMMGVHHPWEPDHCDMLQFRTVLDAEWAVLDGEHVVAHGALHGRDNNFAVSDKYLSRYLGDFSGEKNKSYVLEVKFAKDGTALSVTHPHLIIVVTKPTDI